MCGDLIKIQILLASAIFFFKRLFFYIFLTISRRHFLLFPHNGENTIAKKLSRYISVLNNNTINLQIVKIIN